MQVIVELLVESILVAQSYPKVYGMPYPFVETNTTVNWRFYSQVYKRLSGVDFLNPSLNVLAFSFDSSDYFDPPNDLPELLPQVNSTWSMNLTLSGSMEGYSTHILMNWSSNTTTIHMVPEVLTPIVNATYGVLIYEDTDSSGTLDPAVDVPVNETTLLSGGSMRFFVRLWLSDINGTLPSQVVVKVKAWTNETALGSNPWGAKVYRAYLIDNFQIAAESKVVEVYPYSPPEFPQTHRVMVEGTVFAVRFAAPMDNSTFAGNITLRTKDDNIVCALNYQKALSPSLHLFVIPAGVKLHSLSVYKILVSRNIKDSSGRNLVSDFVWQFSTIINREEGGLLTFLTSSGLSKVSIPPEVLPYHSDVSLTVIHSDYSNWSDPLPGAYYFLKGYYWDGKKFLLLNDYNSDGVQDASFSKELQIELSYSDSDSDGYVDGTVVREERVDAFRKIFSFGKASWERMKGVLDAKSNVVAFSSRYLGIYALKATSPTTVRLLPPFPNPATPNSGVKIAFEVPDDMGEPVFYIYTLTGEPVAVLKAPDEVFMNRGYAVWNGKNEVGVPVAPGVYIVVMKVSNIVKVTKVLMLR